MMSESKGVSYPEMTDCYWKQGDLCGTIIRMNKEENKKNENKKNDNQTEEKSMDGNQIEERRRILQALTSPMLEWYKKTARDLPWREKPEAYRVWISEIMLQQTRIEAVKPYYERFLREFPDVCDLAEAPEEKVLKCWEGLGYYSRARNLQKAAILCMEQYGGELPASYEALKGLPGIGNYTAGAVASIAYRIPVPAVDGNVLRVLSRVFADSRDISRQGIRTETEKLLLTVIPEENPGAFNEAIMEIGETICIPNGFPLCGQCPLASHCLARIKGEQELYPVKAPKKERKKEEKTILVLLCHDRAAIRKRPAKGLLAGMYELPWLEGFLSEEEVINQLSLKEEEKGEIHSLGKAKHIFSHVEWHMKGYRIQTEEPVPGDWEYVSLAELKEKYPIPNAFSAYTEGIV